MNTLYQLWHSTLTPVPSGYPLAKSQGDNLNSEETAAKGSLKSLKAILLMLSEVAETSWSITKHNSGNLRGILPSDLYLQFASFL